MGWIKKIFGVGKSDTANSPVIDSNDTACCMSETGRFPDEEADGKLPSLIAVSSNKTIDVPQEKIEITFKNPPVEAGNWYFLSEASNTIYNVNLNNVQCNCLNFLKGRNGFSVNDPGRYCKHLFSLSRKIGFCTQLTNNHELILEYLEIKEDCFSSLGSTFYLKHLGKNDILVGQNTYSEWFDLFTRERQAIDKNKCTGDIERYGYSVAKKHWAYDFSPYQSVKIENFLKTLPKTEISNKISQQTGIEFSIAAFLDLQDNFFLNGALSSRILRELDNVTEVNIIKNTLLKLGRAKNITKTRLASNWLKHGKNLLNESSRESLFFLKNAVALNPKCGAKTIINRINEQDIKKLKNKMRTKSIYQSADDKFKKLFLHNKEIINLSIEKKEFDKLPSSIEKSEAFRVINMEIPDWYDKSKKHTFVGYAYADFVRILTERRSIEVRSEESNKAINYIASLAILDATISKNTIAELFKIKGLIYEKFENKKLALIYFNQALAFNDKVGLKKYISNL